MDVSLFYIVISNIHNYRWSITCLHHYGSYLCRYLFCLQSSITVYINIYIGNYIYIYTIIHLWCMYCSQSIRMSQVFVYINHGTKTWKKYGNTSQFHLRVTHLTGRFAAHGYYGSEHGDSEIPAEKRKKHFVVGQWIVHKS